MPVPNSTVQFRSIYNPMTTTFYDDGSSAQRMFEQQTNRQHQTDMGRQQGDFGLRQAEIASAPAMLNAQNQQRRFDTVFPFVQGQMGQMAGQMGQGGNWGYQQGQGPRINAGPVWNPQQIQQQVNQAQGQNNATAASQNREVAERTAAHGFGSRSPLLMALQGANNNAALAENTRVGAQIPWTAAQGNASQMLNSQTAAANQYNQQQQQALTARGQTIQGYSALLSSLAGLM